MKARNGTGVEIVAGADSSGEELRSLYGWLVEDPEFRGRVRMHTAAPRPGEMGLDTYSMMVDVAAGGGLVMAASVRTLGTVLVTWLKARKNPVDLTLRGTDGAEVKLSAGAVSDLPADGVSQMLDEMARRLGPAEGAPGTRAAEATS
jgi:hypothetical protein